MEDDLLPIEDLAELEPIVEIADVDTIFSPVRNFLEEARILHDTAIASVIRSYDSLPESVAIVDNSSTLEFLYQNTACRALLQRYKVGQQTSFAAGIWKQMGTEAISAIRRGLADPSSGYSWKGDIVFRSRDRLTLDLKAHIFPLWPQDGAGERPAVFSVYFDDVTADRHNYQRLYLEALLDASLLKDNQTGRHVQRVNLYSRCLAEALYADSEAWPEVTKDFVEDIGWLAAMHDVGKIGVPERIIHKDGPLDDEEWREMREHPITGALILASYPNRMAQDIAKSHHERWNGYGYPYNLLGEKIPLAARIVAIADVYDALRTQRPYKEPLTHEAATGLIVKESGGHFDPALVATFSSLSGEFSRIQSENLDN